MVRRRTSSGGPSYKACTRCAAWQEANVGRAEERLRVHVAMSQPPDVRLCWGLTVVAGYHRLEDRRNNVTVGCFLAKCRNNDLTPGFTSFMFCFSWGQLLCLCYTVTSILVVSSSALDCIRKILVCETTCYVSSGTCTISSCQGLILNFAGTAHSQNFCVHIARKYNRKHKHNYNKWCGSYCLRFFMFHKQKLRFKAISLMKSAIAL